MSYDVSALTDYVKQESKTLLMRALLTPKTIAYIKAKGTVLTGVKTSQEINDIDTGVTFQNGKGCGFNAVGSTTISKRVVTVGTIKVQESYCPADLEDKYTQLALEAGSAYDSLVFAKEYTAIKTKKIAIAMEKAIWSGDTASADENLKRFDGLRKIIKAAAGVVNGNVGAVTVATGITKTNVIAILDGVYDSIPEAILDREDLFIACGQEVFKTYVRAIRDANLVHYDSKEALAAGEIKILGTNVSLISTTGLNGTNELFSTYWANIVFATDLLDEEDKFDIFHAKEADEVRFSAKWKAGVQIAFPEEAVKFVLVP